MMEHITWWLTVNISYKFFTTNKDFFKVARSMTPIAKSSTLLIESSIAPTSELGLLQDLDSSSLFLVITIVKLSIIPKY